MKKFIASVGAFSLPALTLAQTLSLQTGLGGFTNSLSQFITTLVPIILAIIVLFYLWEGFQYFWGDDDRKTAAKKTMWEGIIVIAVMVSIWGLVAFVQNTFGLGTTGPGTSFSQIVPRS